MESRYRYDPLSDTLLKGKNIYPGLTWSWDKSGHQPVRHLSSDVQHKYIPGRRCPEQLGTQEACKQVQMLGEAICYMSPEHVRTLNTRILYTRTSVGPWQMAINRCISFALMLHVTENITVLWDRCSNLNSLVGNKIIYVYH